MPLQFLLSIRSEKKEVDCSVPYGARYALSWTMYLSRSAYWSATLFGSCFTRAAIFLFSTGSLTKLVLNVGDDASAEPATDGSSRSDGCGKSMNQSVNPIWA